jgi:hypothetical protein
VVSWLAKEFVRQGLQAILFASGDSETTANLVACASQTLRFAGTCDHVANTLSMLHTLAFVLMWMVNAALGQSDRSKNWQDDAVILCRTRKDTDDGRQGTKSRMTRPRSRGHLKKNGGT